ncbi:MAG: hypothetical protein WC069_06705 [Candidatus Shapirobacteria bacterium]
MKYIVSLLSFVLVFSFQDLGCKKTDGGDGTKPEIVVLGANPMFWALNYPYTEWFKASSCKATLVGRFHHLNYSMQ